MANDYYETLGVSKTAAKEEIKKAYKNLAKKYHPDVSKDAGAEEKFKKISEAYAVLGDDAKRAQYDQFGDATFHQRYSQEDIFRNFNFSGFEDLFGNDIFDMFFGGRGGRQRQGRDLRYDLEISFKEAAFGMKKELTVEKLDPCEACEATGAEGGKLETCSSCSGTGQQQKVQRTPFGMFSQITTCKTCLGAGSAAAAPCRACRGEGRVGREKTITVTIPAGVDEGTQLRIRGEGEAGPHGARAGDLYVVLSVEDHELFRREGNDLFLEIPLMFSQAALGESVEVPTLEKEVVLKIPSGTQAGTRFRIAGKGVPHLHSSGRGDLYVIVNIVTPKRLSREQRMLFEELKKTEEKKTLLQRMKEFAKEL
ncbi:MAG TPA: molecular chaperone DnaJ [Candidatus Nanoarchaeia archaeon]|nr:molecular chaperone DnaJ [Candidatus Nanoarchaeia archaeon]